jgi:hypothetical protein
MSLGPLWPRDISSPERKLTMKKLITLSFAIVALIFLNTGAHADLAFLLSPPSFIKLPGDMFTITADVTNTNPSGGASYAVDNYALSVSPNTLTLPTDLNDDGTGFYTDFQRTFAPGDEVNKPIIDFTLGNSVAPGNYTVTLILQDVNNIGLAQQSFNLEVQASPSAVPEGGCLPLLLGSALPLIGLALRRRRKQFQSQ